MLKYYRQLGWAGVVCGMVCVIGFFIPDITGVKVSMIAMLPGFLCSSLYIMYTTKYEIETPKINPGYIGLLLSSAPVLLFLYFLITS
jgi:hypothetical protein